YSSPDYKEALKWFRKAAAQGNFYAQRQIGIMYSKGQGVPQNYKKALTWYRKAAAQGGDYEQFIIGAIWNFVHHYNSTVARE
ncbi:hypothetical protein TI05_15780, partial [Achromatium sp. WMS3]